MRRLAIVIALASTVLATPAFAQNQGWYAGIEGGLMLPEDTDFNVSGAGTTGNDGFTIDHKRG